MANIAAKNSDDAKIVLHATAVNGSEETQQGEKARMELGHSSPRHNCGRLTAVQHSSRLRLSFGRTPVDDAAVKAHEAVAIPASYEERESDAVKFCI